MKRGNLVSTVALALVLAWGGAAAAQLRIGIQDDPDALDPATSGFFVGRLVFAALCDKLIDIDKDTNFVPQLATAWSWSADGRSLSLTLRPGVVFHDGEPLDAQAVKVNLDRYRLAAESRRKAELKAIDSVEVVGPLTLRIGLNEPHAPLIAVLADRAGMMVSPRAIATLGDKLGSNPICAGPFRFTQRVAQERIVLDRFDRYWDAASIRVDRITYMVIPDPSIRLANLRAGALDMIERLAATDIRSVRDDRRLRLLSGRSLGFQTLVFNLAHGSRAEHPLGKDPRVRAALEHAIDRRVINRVVFDGEFIASNQAEAPGSPFANADRPVPERDIARARALLREAGHERVRLSLTVINNPIDAQIAEVIQTMARDAGFDIQIVALEAAAQVAALSRGDFEAAIVPWSGRPDPDGNIAIWIQCDGFINWGRYCNASADSLLARARATNDVEQRQSVYRELSNIYLDQRPLLVLYHAKWLWGIDGRVEGFTPVPDGLIRPQGISIRN